MIRSRILYILLVLVCFAFSMIYQASITAIILVILLAYPVIAAILTAAQLIFVKAEFPEKRLVAEKNTPFEYYLGVKNNSIFPCAPMEVICLLPDSDTAIFGERRVYVSLSPFSSARLAIEGRHQYRGCYSARIQKISVVDPLRIVRISKKSADNMVMVFLPRRISLDELVSASVSDNDLSHPTPITNDKEDFSHVREYRIGDVMQLVHWKLTAKSDELMIKQFDSINDRRSFVLCDWNSGEGDLFLRMDTVIETAVAFVRDALDCGVHSTIDVGRGGSRELIQVTNEGEFESFFDLMSVFPVGGERYDYVSLIDDTDINSAAMVVLVTPNLTEEVLERARNIAKICTVYLAFINLAQRAVEDTLFEDEFLFLNVRGSGSDALKLAAAMASKIPD